MIFTCLTLQLRPPSLGTRYGGQADGRLNRPPLISILSRPPRGSPCSSISTGFSQRHFVQRRCRNTVPLKLAPPTSVARRWRHDLRRRHLQPHDWKLESRRYDFVRLQRQHRLQCELQLVARRFGWVYACRSRPRASRQRNMEYIGRRHGYLRQRGYGSNQRY